MGPINAGFMRVTCLALLAMSMIAYAQESAQKQNTAPAKTEMATKVKRAVWNKVGDGVWEAKVPRFSNDDEGKYKPEFAIVRLTAEKYEEFQKSKKEDFLNKYTIFTYPVKKLSSCAASKPKKDEPKKAKEMKGSTGGDEGGEPYWYLAIAHWPGSTAACRAYSGWSEPKRED